MLKRCGLVVLFAALGLSGVLALDNAAIERADELYEDDRPQAALDILEPALSSAGSGPERAEVLWRLARATLDVGEKQEDREEPVAAILETYVTGEQYGIEAVEADPSNHLGYYWQSANIGKWGQVKGILNSLFKAGPMRELLRQAIAVEPNHADSYYVLGQMYEQVPGVISFGNTNFAVSFSRLSIELHEAELASGVEDELNHDFYIQHAAHLIKRNWNARKREREQENSRRRYDRANNELDRGSNYEGTIDIPNQSDRDEARDLLDEMIRLLQRLPDRSDAQNRQLEEANELLSGL